MNIWMQQVSHMHSLLRDLSQNAPHRGIVSWDICLTLSYRFWYSRVNSPNLHADLLSSQKTHDNIKDIITISDHWIKGSLAALHWLSRWSVLHLGLFLSLLGPLRNHGFGPLQYSLIVFPTIHMYPYRRIYQWTPLSTVNLNMNGELLLLGFQSQGIMQITVVLLMPPGKTRAMLYTRVCSSAASVAIIKMALLSIESVIYLLLQGPPCFMPSIIGPTVCAKICSPFHWSMLVIFKTGFAPLMGKPQRKFSLVHHPPLLQTFHNIILSAAQHTF